MNMKKIGSAALAAALAAACAFPAAAGDKEPAELTVFAAASMTETLTELAETYEKDHPDVKISYNFDSSGTLETQILQGADCDIFLSAAQKQMNELDKDQDSDKNPDGNDYLLPDTRIDLLENKVALAVPDGNPKGVTGFDDLARRLGSAIGVTPVIKDTDMTETEEASEAVGGSVKTDETEASGSEGFLLAMGNSDVPVGQYTQKILDYYGLPEEDLAAAGCITYGSNVKEVTTQIAENSVDCGIIYQTDAYSEGLTVIDTASPEMCGQVIYPAAVLKDSKHPDEAKDFLAFLQTSEAQAVFEKVGFSPVN